MPNKSFLHDRPERGTRLKQKPEPDLAQRLQHTLGKGYRITEELAAGGMSRVFVAKEVELGRYIVVKVLPPDLGTGLNVDRFRREIQMAAQLQHPHIVPLLAAGAKGELLYFTMPRIEGETLRSRILRSGELPVGETIRVLRDVADALEYAHAHGVIHRDIKPENILVSGHHALVTDFGVAKALSAATSQSNLTSIGVALGTPTYMSPEQAAGDPMTDHRTDIYALGVVGYELLAGRPPFSGVNPQQVMAAQVTDPPVPISRHRANIPASLASLIMRCLEKKPADRFQTADEVREQLEITGAASGGTVPTPAVAATAPVQATGGRNNAPIFVTGATLLLAASLIAISYLGGSRQEFEVGGTAQITNDPGVEITPALSPDGKMLAYSRGEPDNTSIFVRQVSGGEAIRLANGRAPQWSPDGSKLVYVDSAGIAMVPALGGSPQRLIRRSGLGLALSPVWSHDGKLLAYTERLGGMDDAIWIANADGTEPRKVLTATEPHSLSWSPDDSRLAFVQGNLTFVYGADQFGNIAPSALWTADREGKGAAPLTDSIHHSVSPLWTSDGEGVLYVSNIRGGRDLYYQRVRGNRADGRPQRLTTGLKIHGIAGGGEGSIAYSVWNTSVGIWSLPLPRSGTASVLSAHQLTSATERIESVSVSPDGEWVAFDSDRSGNMDIYKMRRDGTGVQQLTRNPADEFRPIWSPDGRQIAFHSWRSGNRDSYVMSADGAGDRMIAGGPAHEWAAAWSPDGRQLAFVSDRTGRQEIYLVPATGGNARRLTSQGGVSHPRWSQDGKLIAYGGADDALRLIPAQGGRERVLVAPDVFGAVTAVGGWSTEGGRIYFRVRAPDGSLNIAQVSADGSNPSLLVRFDDPERRGYRGDFSTDGKTIYVTIGKHEADIWVMDLKKK